MSLKDGFLLGEWIMAADVGFIDYVAPPVSRPEDGLVVEEFKPLEGLAPYFDRVDALQTTPAVKSGLTLMLLEMDSALHAHAAGDKDVAVNHHESMLRHARGVFGRRDDLKGKSADAQKCGADDVYKTVQRLFISLTSEAVRGEKRQDGSRGKPKPWGRALGEIAEGLRARNHARAHLQLQPVEEEQIAFASPRRPYGMQDAFTWSSAPQAPGKPKTPWVSREYKNLATVLEAFQQKTGGARKDAVIALACLNAINRDEYDWTRGGKAEKTEEQRKHFNEYHKRLDRYVHNLLRNKAVTEGQKAGLSRFYQPAKKHAQRFKDVINQGGALSRIFHTAVSSLLQAALRKGLAAGLPRKAASSAPASRTTFGAS
jgi:hypothetical protein